MNKFAQALRQQIGGSKFNTKESGGKSGARSFGSGLDSIARRYGRKFKRQYDLGKAVKRSPLKGAVSGAAGSTEGTP